MAARTYEFVQLDVFTQTPLILHRQAYGGQES
jgi:hypothetical protein